MPQIEYTISEKMILEELKDIKSLSEIMINSLYRALPSGQKNYGKNAELGYFSVESPSTNSISLRWSMSEKSRRHYHGPVSRDIANLYIDSQTYDLNRRIIPEKLAKDTEKVLELIGFRKDNDDPDGW